MDGFLYSAFPLWALKAHYATCWLKRLQRRKHLKMIYLLLEKEWDAKGIKMCIYVKLWKK